MSRSTFLGVCLLGAVLPAAAQSPHWTEANTLELLNERHPAMRQLLEERELAAAEGRRAALFPNPELTLLREAPGEARETTAQLDWALPIDGRRSLAIEAAAAGVEASEQRLAQARLALRQELRAAHAALALAGGRVRLIDEQLTRQSLLLERERARLAAGEVAGTTVRRLELETALLRSARAGWELERLTARGRLEAFGTSVPPEAEVLLPELPAPPSSPPELGAHPRIAALEHELTRGALEARLAAKVLAAPRLGAGWKRVEDGGLAAEGAVLSLGWELPLFDRGQAGRLEAEARRRASAAALELARHQLEAESRAALAAYRRAREEALTLARLGESLAPLLAGSEAAYTAGELTLTDLLDVLRETRAVRERALEALAGALAAHRALELAFGSPLSLSPGDAP